MRAPGQFFSNKHNIALSLSTDGVPLYKSSPVSLWPVYLVILNLPARIRMYAENVVLCGLWLGPTKPAMSLLLNPLADCIEKLSTLGMEIRNVCGQFTIRAKVMIGVFDLPAKATVLSAKQFNGQYGCSVCLHPGTRLPNNARIYLADIVYPNRTHNEVLAAGVKAKTDKSCVQGIIGVSSLSKTFNLVDSVPVDYMHAVLEGVTKWLMRAWFNSKFHSSPFYIGLKVSDIDCELLNQRPPSEFSRPPRSIKKHMSYWKASELRNWLLFYSLPLLLDILPSLYWHHYALLVCAMHLLLSDQITLNQIDAAEQMLIDFHSLLPELYGEASCTANAHLLTHLTKYVRLWGPLWTHSAFGFESKNGHLKNLFHGKADIIQQLLFNVDVSHTLQHVYSRLIEYESEKTISYLDDLHHLKYRKNMLCIGTHLYAIGQCSVVRPTADQSQALNSTSCIQVFSKLLKNSCLYYSSSYKRSAKIKRDNTYCSFKTDGVLCFGKMECFTITPKAYALVREVSRTNVAIMDEAGHPCRDSLDVYKQANILGSFIVQILPANDQGRLLAIPIEDISKVVLLSVSNKHYCIVQPNNIERH